MFVPKLQPLPCMHATPVDALRIAYGRKDRLSWLVNSDPFCQTPHLRDRALLQSLTRDGIFVIPALGEIPCHRMSPDRHRAEQPGLRISKDRGIGQKPTDPAAQE